MHHSTWKKQDFLLNRVIACPHKSITTLNLPACTPADSRRRNTATRSSWRGGCCCCRRTSRLTSCASRLEQAPCTEIHLFLCGVRIKHAPEVGFDQRQSAGASCDPHQPKPIVFTRLRRDEFWDHGASLLIEQTIALATLDQIRSGWINQIVHCLTCNFLLPSGC